MTRSGYLIIAGATLVSAAANAFDFHFDSASSSAGQFSVTLPKPFGELPPNFAINQTAAIRPTKTFAIGGKPAPGVIFIAVKLVYESANNAQSIVQGLKRADPPGFTRVYIKEVKAAGLSGFEVKTNSRLSTGYERVFLADDTVFLLSVEAPAAQDAELKEPARKFLDSLTVAK
jgi:hypothetical protein